ncbi:NAD(P)/FAD-dependent oxidoreductase [Paraliobacillus sp. JSM ZJ581]|uniref:dihydrolipoyl dehydrogenase family protein n=1 Tax=Paraliobacillus sp. JSM ZJ581 TaxID=3342118 RepID=UPI0035A99DAE
MSKHDYDLIVIGAGAGGLNASLEGVSLGKNVLLVEKFQPGGECTWTGCIPSKALIHIADNIHTAKKFTTPQIDTKNVMNQVRQLRKKAHEGESVELLQAHGIKYINGFATFVDNNTIEVNGENITATNIIISTGSRAFIPSIPGINTVDYLTNENFFELNELPKSLIVLGGGAIGVELSQALSRLGVSVTLVEMAESILYKEDKEIVELLTDILRSEGISVLTGAKGNEVKQVNNLIELTVEKNGKQEIVVAEKMLVALGRKANLENIKLERIGIKKTDKSIIVNEHMQTNIPNIYAVGDIVGPYLFSHMGGAQGRAAVRHMFNQTDSKPMTKDYAWTTFTHPELARTGFTEKEASEKYGDNIRIYKTSYSSSDRAVVEGKSQGLVKVICDCEGKIVGASILGERAGELLGQIQLMKLFNQPFYKLGEAIQPYPTYSEVLTSLSQDAHE